MKGKILQFLPISIPRPIPCRRNLPVWSIKLTGLAVDRTAQLIRLKGGSEISIPQIHEWPLINYHLAGGTLRQYPTKLSKIHEMRFRLPSPVLHVICSGSHTKLPPTQRCRQDKLITAPLSTNINHLYFSRKKCVQFLSSFLDFLRQLSCGQAVRGLVVLPG